jgi:hypothetical protein
MAQQPTDAAVLGQHLGTKQPDAGLGASGDKFVAEEAPQAAALERIGNGERDLGPVGLGLEADEPAHAHDNGATPGEDRDVIPAIGGDQVLPLCLGEVSEGSLETEVAGLG